MWAFFRLTTDYGTSDLFSRAGTPVDAQLHEHLRGQLPAELRLLPAAARAAAVPHRGVRREQDLPLYLIEVFGASKTMVGIVVSCYTVAALVVRPAAGFVLDMFNRRVLYLIAYFLFAHVRQRVVAWQDPFSVWETSGYQILQGLFAIGAGGWLGVGLGNGSPELIPFVQQDYMFAAICEELGGLFAICMILVCMSMFLLVVNISYRIKKRFYKLIALGLGTEYAFQVFLTIGGVSKFIPMTGITLPLVSYGGSSVLATIIMLAIIQGLYILREDEDEEFERQKEKI